MDLKYFTIPVNIVVQASTREEAQLRAAIFMPWTTDGRSWSIHQHEGIIKPNIIDNWTLDGVDSDEMEGKLREMDLR